MSCTLRGRGIGIACSAAIRDDCRLSTDRPVAEPIASAVVGGEDHGLRPRPHSVSRSTCSWVWVWHRRRRWARHEHDRRIVGEGADRTPPAGRCRRTIGADNALEAAPDGADEHVGLRAGRVVQPPLHLDFKMRLNMADRRRAEARRIDMKVVDRHRRRWHKQAAFRSCGHFQAVLLPAIMGTTLTQTAALIGVGRATVARLQADFKQAKKPTGALSEQHQLGRAP